MPGQLIPSEAHRGTAPSPAFLEMQTCPSVWDARRGTRAAPPAQPGVPASSQPPSPRFCAEGAAGHAPTTALSKALPTHVRAELQPRACAAMSDLTARPDPLPDPRIVPARRLTRPRRLGHRPRSASPCPAAEPCWRRRGGCCPRSQPSRVSPAQGGCPRELPGRWRAASGALQQRGAKRKVYSCSPAAHNNVHLQEPVTLFSLWEERRGCAEPAREPPPGQGAAAGGWPRPPPGTASPRRGCPAVPPRDTAVFPGSCPGRQRLAVPLPHRVPGGSQGPSGSPRPPRSSPPAPRPGCSRGGVSSPRYNEFCRQRRAFSRSPPSTAVIYGQQPSCGESRRQEQGRLLGGPESLWPPAPAAAPGAGLQLGSGAAARTPGPLRRAQARLRASQWSAEQRIHRGPRGCRPQTEAAQFPPASGPRPGWLLRPETI